MTEKEHYCQHVLDSYIFCSTYMFASSQKYDISFQLGAYYDMRYKGYFIRSKFILGLSRYSDDDTIDGRAEEMLRFMPKSSCRKCKSELNVQSIRLNNKIDIDELYDYHELIGTIHLFSETDVDIQDPWERVLDELLVGTYPDIDEQELCVCKQLVYAKWNYGLVKDSYKEIVSETVHTHREDLFATIKDIEATIQRLIHKGILSQSISYCDIKYKGNFLDRVQIITEPHFVLSLQQKILDEACNAMMEVIEEENAFCLPRLLKYGLRFDESYDIRDYPNTVK